MAFRMILILLVAVLISLVACASRMKRGGGGYGGGYGSGYGNLYGPYYDKFDQYNGIPGFNTYSKYGQGDYGYNKAVFAGGYGNSYGGY